MLLEISDIIAVAIPLLTFFLGVGFSHWSRRGERSAELVEANAILLADSVTAWHQRLYEISAAEAKGNPEKLNELLIDYEQNRHELPKIIRSLEVLRKSNRAAELVDLGERFLETFTELRGHSLYCSMDKGFKAGSTKGSELRHSVCTSLRSDRNVFLLDETTKPNADNKLRGAEIRKFKLNHSDELLQAINRQVGRIHRRY